MGDNLVYQVVEFKILFFDANEELKEEHRKLLLNQIAETLA